MEELIARIVAATGLPAETAETALGIVLGLLRTQGNRDKVQELFDRLPGAEELARQQGAGGLLGKLGGPLAAITKLTAAGLSMDQIKALGMTTLDYAKEKAGAPLVRDVAGSIPGLSGYV